jgi:Spy/CpxP family protein refolding chaperone
MRAGELLPESCVLLCKRFFPRRITVMKLKQAFFAGMMVAILSAGYAQQAGPGRTGASGQGPRQPMTAFGGFGFHPFLIWREDVQKELKLTEAQKKSLQTLPQSLRPPRQGAPRSQPGQSSQPGQGQRERGPRPNFEEMMLKAIKDILTPAQEKRLEELTLQWMGPPALLLPDVAKKVGLTTQQQQKIRELEQAHSQKARETFQRGRNNPQEREKMLQQWVKLRKELDTKILALLTPAQKQKWQSLLGKPFTFNPPQIRESPGDWD